MTLYILIGLTILGLSASLLNSARRTGVALKMSLNMGKGMVWELLTILGWIAIVLAYLPEERIAWFLGDSRGFLASVNAALIGSVTILPGVIAFPLARQLNESGAAITAIAAFISTLTMVGLVTAPLEKKHFGLRFTLYRNGLSFIFALLIAVVMGVLL